MVPVPRVHIELQAATALLQVSEGRLHICLSGLQTSFLSYSPCKCLFIYMEMLNIWENGIEVRDDCWPAALKFVISLYCFGLLT